MRRAAGGVHSVSLEKKLVSGHGEARRCRGEAGRGEAKQRGCGGVRERVQQDGVRVRSSSTSSMEVTELQLVRGGIPMLGSTK